MLKVLTYRFLNAALNPDKNRAARKAWEERNRTAALESFKPYRERHREKTRARLTVSKQGREKRRALGANQDAILAIYRSRCRRVPAALIILASK
jgi:hypothetical protein